jgi:hypothetical protein
MKLVVMNDGPVLVAARQKPVSIKGGRVKDLSQMAATCYHVQVDGAKLGTSAFGYVQFHAFDKWVLVDPATDKGYIIGYDVEGENPLEPPNNPMGRLTIAVSDILKEEPNGKDVSEDAAREAFSSKYATSGQRTYIRGKKLLFESARNIDAVAYNKGSGLCVGITDNEGLWAKAFDSTTLKWDRELGFVKGEYVDVAVASTKGAIGIITADRAGRIGYRSVKSATDLSDSKDDTVVAATSWKDGERPLRVVVARDGEDLVVGIVVERQASAAHNSANKVEAKKRELVIYRRQQGVWQKAGGCALEPSSDGISVLSWNNMVLCAYSYAKDGETCGVIRNVTAESPTSLPASAEAASEPGQSENRK